LAIPDQSFKLSFLFGRTAVVHIQRKAMPRATYMATDGGPKSQCLGIYVTLELKGMSDLLSPTWEQWFDPDRPVSAMDRNKK
jgi:hypothetical protein